MSGNPVNWFDPLGLKGCRCDTSNNPNSPHGSPTLDSVTGPPGQSNIQPLTQSTAREANSAATDAARQRMGAGAVAGAILLDSVLAGSRVHPVAGVAVNGLYAIASFAGVGSYDVTFYQSGYSYAHYNYSHHGHPYTVVQQIDKDGNIVAEYLQGPSQCSGQ